MSIFGKNNNIKCSTIPVINDSSFDFEMDSYSLLKSIEDEGFTISVEHARSTYIGLKENSVEILEESLKDFFKDAAEFFKKLATKIIEFAKNTMKLFVSYFQDFDKFLKNNEMQLRSLNPNFTIKGYNFKFPDAPVLTKVYDIASSYNSEINRIDAMTYAEVSKKKLEFVDDINKNKIRASILGVGNEVRGDSFSENSKKLFRDSTEASSINVNKTYLDMIIREYSNIKNLLNETEKKKSKIVTLLNNFEMFFNKRAAVVYDKNNRIIRAETLRTDDDKMGYGNPTNVNYDENKLKTLNSFFDLKYRESKFISNCVVTVYLDKVNALRDCLKQYRSVVRQCLRDKDSITDKD